VHKLFLSNICSLKTLYDFFFIITEFKVNIKNLAPVKNLTPLKKCSDKWGCGFITCAPKQVDASCIYSLAAAAILLLPAVPRCAKLRLGRTLKSLLLSLLDTVE
jgi:hypothetical protein